MQYIHPCLRKRLCTGCTIRFRRTRSFRSSSCVRVTEERNWCWNSHRVFPFKDDVFEAMW